MPFGMVSNFVGQFSFHPPLKPPPSKQRGDFPVFAPLSYVARMRVGDPHDPLLRQVLPLADERQPDGLTDPVR